MSASRRKQEENDLIRKLVAKYFGVHNELTGAFYTLSLNLITNNYYDRLCNIQTDKTIAEYTLNQRIAYTTKLDETREYIFKLLREFSEIIGEYAYLNQQTKVIEKYNFFNKNQPNFEADFSKVMTNEEAESLRIELLKKYNKEIAETIDVNGIEIPKCMEAESIAKFTMQT